MTPEEQCEIVQKGLYQFHEVATRDIPALKEEFGRLEVQMKDLKADVDQRLNKQDSEIEALSQTVERKHDALKEVVESRHDQVLGTLDEIKEMMRPVQAARTAGSVVKGATVGVLKFTTKYTALSLFIFVWILLYSFQDNPQVLAVISEIFPRLGEVLKIMTGVKAP